MCSITSFFDFEKAHSKGTVQRVFAGPTRLGNFVPHGLFGLGEKPLSRQVTHSERC